jgi:hypothetical protein
MKGYEGGGVKIEGGERETCSQAYKLFLGSQSSITNTGTGIQRVANKENAIRRGQTTTPPLPGSCYSDTVFTRCRFMQ